MFWGRTRNWRLSGEKKKEKKKKRRLPRAGSHGGRAGAWAGFFRYDLSHTTEKVNGLVLLFLEKVFGSRGGWGWCYEFYLVVGNMAALHQMLSAFGHWADAIKTWVSCGETLYIDSPFSFFFFAVFLFWGF